VIDVIKSGEVKDYRAAKYSNVKFLTEEQNPVSLVHRESTWAYDLVQETSRMTAQLAPVVSVAA